MIIELPRARSHPPLFYQRALAVIKTHNTSGPHGMYTRTPDGHQTQQNACLAALALRHVDAVRAKNELVSLVRKEHEALRTNAQAHETFADLPFLPTAVWRVKAHLTTVQANAFMREVFKPLVAVHQACVAHLSASNNLTRVRYASVLYQANTDLLHLAYEQDAAEQNAHTQGHNPQGHAAIITRLQAWQTLLHAYLMDAWEQSGKRQGTRTPEQTATLYAGVLTQTQAENFVHQYVLQSRRVANLAAQSVSATRIMPGMQVSMMDNWLLTQGLKRYGYHHAATLVRNDSLYLLLRHGFAEHYDVTNDSAYGHNPHPQTAAIALELLELSGPGRF